jgi:methionine sulfoxide reductase heme-binding subunit
MTTNPTPHLFWITSRAAGIAALVLASLAVALGLLMSTKLLRGRVADLRVTHEVLSLATIVAIVVHAVALLGDKFLHPSLADISLPFASGYKTFWMSLGILAGWATILLGLSFYARRVIGAKRWRSLHRFTALAWLAGLVHAVGMGTDAGQVWFLAMVAIVAIPAAALLAVRLARPAGAGRQSAAGRPAASRPATAARTTVPSLRPGWLASQSEWRGGQSQSDPGAGEPRQLPARGVVPPRGVPVRGGG